ncbi:MAG: methionine synthase, partial [Acidimicrobiales bacterium]
MSNPPPGPMATGIGSWPGRDVSGAVGAVAELLGPRDLLYLPELPARGPAAAMVGRAVGIMADPAAGTGPLGAAGPAAEARDLLAGDVEVAAAAFPAGATVKLAVCGPVTLGAA